MEYPQWFLKRYEQAKPDIEIITSAGYKLIGYSVMMIEDVYYLDTEENAHRAYEELEKGKKGPQGWWYGIEDKEKNEQDYIRQFGETPLYIEHKNTKQ